jgi:hypothetical protein
LVLSVTVNLRVLVNCMEKGVNQIYKEITESASKRRRLRIIKRSLRTNGTALPISFSFCKIF